MTLVRMFVGEKEVLFAFKVGGDESKKRKAKGRSAGSQTRRGKGWTMSTTVYVG